MLRGWPCGLVQASRLLPRPVARPRCPSGRPLREWTAAALPAAVDAALRGGMLRGSGGIRHTQLSFLSRELTPKHGFDWRAMRTLSGNAAQRRRGLLSLRDPASKPSFAKAQSALASTSGSVGSADRYETSRQHMPSTHRSIPHALRVRHLNHLRLFKRPVSQCAGLKKRLTARRPIFRPCSMPSSTAFRK